jgi:ATP-dependent Lhr-like helicase
MRYRRLALGIRPAVAWGDAVVAFPWIGDRALNTLALALSSHGLRAAPDGAAIVIHDADPGQAIDALRAISNDPPDLNELVAQVQNKQTEKHHWRLGLELLDADYASSRLDTAGAAMAAATLAGL